MSATYQVTRLYRAPDGRLRVEYRFADGRVRTVTLRDDVNADDQVAQIGAALALGRPLRPSQLSGGA